MLKSEEEILSFWQENSVFQKTLDKNKGKKQFIFYEGPPTANAKPGLHHVLARVFKDIICRYKTMRGFAVPRRAGWDTHGLPVEIEIEKKLGLKNKSEVEKFGIAKFNELAKKSVWEYKEDWEKLTGRIGFWLDMEHPYITYENSYIEKLWGILKKIDERGLLYKSHKVVPWCPRCGTALSSHELAQGYQTKSDTSLFVKFKAKSEKLKVKKGNVYILSWTTTPWTLPGNVALAINPKHKFVRIPDPTERDGWLILEKQSARRLESILGLRKTAGLAKTEILKTADVLKLEYEPLFKIKALESKNSYKVYPADFVTAEEGTGVVHTAVMYGEDDYELGKKFNLPQHHTVNEQGKFTKDVPELAGMYVKDPKTEEKILKILKPKTYHLEPIKHDYPFCWRCETPVLYYARDSWFIAMSRLRKELLAANKKINWVPEHLKEGRFGEWLKEVKDWAISRERYWGTSLPIWEHLNPVICEITRLVVGSREELQKYGGAPPQDLHRPYIDEIVLNCPNCGGKMRRVKEVIDVWFDSGAMPFASGEYPERYPADYICEAVDQTRGWFYILLAVGVLMEAGPSYRNVVSLGHLLDKHGQKMSKSKGNVVDPWELIKKYGVDVVRWYFYTVNPPGEQKRFNEEDLMKTKRRFHDLLYNSYVFYKTYSLETSDVPNINGNIRTSDVHILDRWILVRLNETVGRATEKLDDYDIHGAAKAIELLVDDLSHWYIRRSRKRPEALPVLGYVFLELSKLIAPFVPFFAEALYQSFSFRKTVGLAKTSILADAQKLSVHLEDWPQADKKLVDKKLLDQMAEVRRWASLALAKRAAAGIKIRQPLAFLKVKTQKSKIKSGELLRVLGEEVNVKEVIFDPKIEEKVELDTKITPELEKEGIFRELVRMIQDWRKEQGLRPQDKIELRAALPEEMLEAAQANDKRLREEVNATKINYQASPETDLTLL